MKKTLLPIVLICTAVAILYGRVLSFGFVNWDDLSYLQNNPLLTGSFFQTVRKIFSDFCFGNYFPLQLLSYSVEKSIFGFYAGAFHASNILLHGINACLVYLFFVQLFRDSKISVLTAIIFAGHPVHVESVAWISERKDVLFLFFLLLSAITYFSYLKTNKKSSLFLSYAMYVCSLLSKSAGVTFPLLAGITIVYTHSWTTLRKQVWSLIPFVAFAGAASCVQMIGGLSYGVWGDGYPVRTIIDSIVVYVRHLILPIGLSPRYSQVPHIPWYLLSLLFFGCGVLWYKQKLFRWALLWFVCALLPVLHIAPIQIIMADRYLYLAALPVYWFCAYCSVRFVQKISANWEKKIIIFLVTCVMTILFCLTLNLTDTWRSTGSIWRRAMRTDKADPLPVIQLALIEYLESHDIPAAARYFEQAYALDPSNPDVLYNVGMFALEQGDLERAETLLAKLVSIPKYLEKFPTVLLTLLKLYVVQGNFEAEAAILSDGIRTYYPNLFDDLRNDRLVRQRLLLELKQSILTVPPETVSEQLWKLFCAGAMYPTVDFIIRNAQVLHDSPEANFIEQVFLLVMNDEDSVRNRLNILTLSHPFFAYVQPLILANLNGEILADDYFDKGRKLFDAEPLFWLESGIYFAVQKHDAQTAHECLKKVLELTKHWEIFPRVMELRKKITLYQ